MKNQDKVLLNVKQFEEIATKQGAILEDMQLIRNLIFYMPASGNRIIDEQIDLIHSKLQQMVKALDETTLILYNVDDKRELEASGVEVQEVEPKTGD